MIQAQPDCVPGTPVRLVACWTGRNSNGFAQQLANELGVPVLGSTTRVSAATLQPLAADVMGAVKTVGRWRLFMP